MSNRSMLSLRRVAASAIAAALSLSLAIGAVPALAREDVALDGDEVLEAIADAGEADPEGATDVDATADEAEPLAASAPESEPAAVSITHSGEWGECSWSIDSDGLFKIWPTNGDSGKLADSNGFSDDSWLFPWFEYGDEVKAVSIAPGVSLPSDSSYLLYNCDNLEMVDATGWDTSNVTNMVFMFGDCDNLKSVNAIGWDTSNVTNMSGMFASCNRLEWVGTTGWDTSSVTDMSMMFSMRERWLSSDNLDSQLKTVDVSGWDVSSVKTMSKMFNYCCNLESLDVSKWDTSHVERFDSIFANCLRLKTIDVSGWDTSSAISMSDMFSCFEGDYLDVSNWDTSKVTLMDDVFSHCVNLTSLDISNWDTSSALTMLGTFAGCKNLTSLDVSKWDTSKVKEMGYLFENCASLTSLDVSNWDTSAVKGMDSLFSGCASLTSLDVSNWDTSAVEDMDSLFSGCTSLNSLDISGWSNANVNEEDSVFIDYMFSDCPALSRITVGDKYDASKAFPAATGESGKWWSTRDCKWFTVEEIQTLRKATADTYITELPADVADATIPPIDEQIYNGKAIEPMFTVTLGSIELQNGLDYDVTYKDNINAGTATAIVTGKGRYAGKKSVAFEVVPASVEKATIDAVADQAYTGKAIEPAPVVKLGSTTLKSGADYTVSYKDNTNAGTATLTITGKGNYTGTKSVTFKIVPASIAKATVDAVADQAYTGKAIEPAPVVKLGSTTLKSGADYTVSYKDNTNAGTATVTITGKGNYTGTKSVTFKIVKAAMETQEMYRLYNPNSGEHFYTADGAERDHLASLGWRYEGVGWTAPAESQTPVHRLYNPVAGEHHYTSDLAERDMLVRAGWRYEGIGWYSDDAKSVPLYRQYNPNAFACNHNYTTDKEENDYLVSLGWRYEGIGWYGVKQ